MSKGDWLLIALMAYILILLPSILAFLISFYTPAVGLSCRSMTFMIYMLCQIWLVALWIWNVESTTFDSQNISHVPFTLNPAATRADPCSSMWFPIVWYAQVILCGVFATFTSIGGTMMQIIGVYRNCLCNIRISNWRNPDDVLIDIGNNSAEMISYAEHTWTGNGIGAITFLGLVTFLGWWYQKRLRYQFKLIIERIGEDAEDHLELNGSSKASS